MKRTKRIWSDLKTEKAREDAFSALLEAKLLVELLQRGKMKPVMPRHPVPQEHLGSPSTSREFTIGHRATRMYLLGSVGDLRDGGTAIILQSLTDRQSWLSSSSGALAQQDRVQLNDVQHKMHKIQAHRRTITQLRELAQRDVPSVNDAAHTSAVLTQVWHRGAQV